MKRIEMVSVAVEATTFIGCVVAFFMWLYRWLTLDDPEWLFHFTMMMAILGGGNACLDSIAKRVRASQKAPQ